MREITPSTSTLSQLSPKVLDGCSEQLSVETGLEAAAGPLDDESAGRVEV
jgi:hypothetical protein